VHITVSSRVHSIARCGVEEMCSTLRVCLLEELEWAMVLERSGRTLAAARWEEAGGGGGWFRFLCELGEYSIVERRMWRRKCDGDGGCDW
jgi:hypothetical protein